MLEFVTAVFGLVVLPVLLTKTTEDRRFEWLKAYLREAWCLVAFVYTIYVISRPEVENMIMKVRSTGFPERHPVIAYAVVGICGAAIFLGYWWFLGKLVPPHLEVFVAPAHLTLSSPLANDTYTFSVRNITASDQYSVTVRFRLLSETLTLNDLKVDVPQSSRKPIGEGYPGSDMGGFGGKTLDNKPVIIMFIYRMIPGETREISITRLKQQPGNIEASVQNFTDIPQPRTIEKGETKFPLFLTETVHVDRIIAVRPF